MNNEIFFSIFSLAHRSAILDWLIVFCAEGFGYLMILFAILFLYAHHDDFSVLAPLRNFTRRAREITLVLSSGVVAYIVASSIKYIYTTPRPFLVFHNITPLFYHGGMDSFPSGHATFFTALAVSLFLIHRRIGIWYLIVAIIVSFGRIASGVHFPIDILGGVILGAGIALILQYFLRIITKQISNS